MPPVLRSRGFSMRAIANQMMLRSHLVQKRKKKKARRGGHRAF